MQNFKKILIILSFFYLSVSWAESYISFTYPAEIKIADLFHSTGIEYTEKSAQQFYKVNPHLSTQDGIIPAQMTVIYPFVPGQKMFWNYDLIRGFDGRVRLELRRVFHARTEMIRTVIQQKDSIAKEKQNGVVKKRFKQSDLFLGASLRYALVSLTDSSGVESEVSSRINWSLQANYIFYSEGHFLIKALGEFTKYSFFPAQYKNSSELSFQTYAVGSSFDYYLTNHLKLFTVLRYASYYSVEAPSATDIRFITYSTFSPSLGASYTYEGTAHFVQLSVALSWAGKYQADYALIKNSQQFSVTMDYRPNVASEWRPNFKLGLDVANRDNNQFRQTISEIHFGLYFLTAL